MEKTLLKEKDYVSPDRIVIEDWGYNLNIIKSGSVAFSFDGEKLYQCPRKIHNDTHKLLNTDELLDFRYFFNENILLVWIYDGDEIVELLKLFECAYRESEWKPFDIDTVKLLFTLDGYAVKCGFSELEGLARLEENFKMRAFHVSPPSLKRYMVGTEWRREYYKESKRVWMKKHGDIDPVLYHLLMYEE